MKIECNHKFLGTVYITDACLFLNLKNPDTTSFFVEHTEDGVPEIKEVSKDLLSLVKVIE